MNSICLRKARPAPDALRYRTHGPHRRREGDGALSAARERSTSQWVGGGLLAADAFTSAEREANSL